MSGSSDTRIPGLENRPPAYRVLAMSRDETVIADVAVQAADDEEAIAVAKQLATGRVIELWDGLRFVERFEPNPNQAAPPQG